MPPQRYTAKLADKIILNEKFIQFSFELVEPSRMPFDAGQYVSIDIKQGGARRSYSISSSPEKEHGFELLLDVSPNGMGVQYLQSLQFGDEIDLLGPLGFFKVDTENTHPPLIFVATGSGIAPFRSMILDQLQIVKTQRPITLYWGLRYVESLFWEDEFEELAIDFPNFHFHPVISRAVPEWPLCRGRVTDCLNVHQFFEHGQYYLCGGAAMIEDVKALLQAKNLPKENIHLEKFF